ncbi:hypothetical protein ABH924_000129 [Arthrobacter sp. GAS37]|uniref:hypothetical protein n=1 Tax=Arthrobacter sp. GAS37 TaxID=3156261 RepID=UPI0038351ABA
MTSMAVARQTEMTSAEVFRHAVYEIIDTDLTAHETRTAVMSLIPKEYHVTHHSR